MRALSTLVAACAVAVLAGCATPSDPKAMAAAAVQVANKHPETISITVAGGKETSAMGASQISDADFREALRASILKSGLFRDVVDGKGGRYQLDAFIGNVSQPLFGASFTVEMEVSYVLADLKAGKPVWKQNVKSVHTATMGDALVGVERLRLANEGAARRNIEAAIREMDKLDLR